MRLARFRHQILIAMGLPACWISQGAEPAPAPRMEPAPKPAVAQFDPKSCRIDTVPETVCGTSDEAKSSGCGQRGDSLGELGQSELHVTTYGGDPRVFARFAFDRRATKKLRQDISASADVAERACCYSQCTPLDVGRAGPIPPSPHFYVSQKCIPAPPGGTSMPDPTNAACPAGIRFSNLDTLASGDRQPYASGTSDRCCYSYIQPRSRVMKGRAARVDGEARFASIGAGDAWRSRAVRPALDVDSLPRELRDRLAAAWLEAARMEHASIASFANLSLRLLALGAPPELVAAAHAAALDEIRHAQVAFELASAYAGTPLAPARFEDAARMTATGDLAALAIETFIDGCINETVAAVEADRAGDGAADPVIAVALHEIADDEARHAELAWAIVAWCVRNGDASLVAELRRELAIAMTAEPATNARGDLGVHGVLGDAALAVVRAEALRDIVTPCLDALAA